MFGRVLGMRHSGSPDGFHLTHLFGDAKPTMLLFQNFTFCMACDALVFFLLKYPVKVKFQHKSYLDPIYGDACCMQANTSHLRKAMRCMTVIRCLLLVLYFVDLVCVICIKYDHIE